MFDKAFIMTELEYLLRVFLAGVCGILIGYERKKRGKGAGVRTHMIVALASSLMMVISKYGFFDVLKAAGMSADPSRVASQIVSGIGFLGAGMIYVHRNSVSGLTTAAGIWATAGIGMAIGAGMYFIGIASAAIVLLSQFVLHKDLKFMQTPAEVYITISIENSPKAVEYVKKTIADHGWSIEKLKTERGEKTLNLKINMVTSSSFDPAETLAIFNDNNYVKSISA